MTMCRHLLYRQLLLMLSLGLSLICSHAYGMLAVPDDEEDVYFILSGEADKAIAEGDYMTAIERLREALAVDPGNPSNILLMSNLGLLYSETGQDSLALDILNHAHNIAPSMIKVLENRALVYRRMHNDKAAMADYDEIIRRDSINADARYYRGMMALYSGDTETAVSDFDVLLQNYPDSYDVWLTQALLNKALGKYREAAGFYRKLTDADPCPEYFGELAECYLHLGELSDASATLGEAIKQWPEDAQLYYYRAWLLRDSFLLKDARNDADRAIALGANPETVNALFE